MIDRRCCFRVAFALLFPLALLGCGGDGLSELESAKKVQDDAATQIKELGGSAEIKKYPVGEAWVVSFPGVAVNDEMIESLGRLGRTAELNLSGATITDEQFIRMVDAAGFLTNIDVSNTGLTDKSMERLASAGVLLELNVAGSKITPAGIAQFKKTRTADSRIRPMFKSTKIKS